MCRGKAKKKRDKRKNTNTKSPSPSKSPTPTERKGASPQPTSPTSPAKSSIERTIRSETEHSEYYQMANADKTTSGRSRPPLRTKDGSKMTPNVTVLGMPPSDKKKASPSGPLLSVPNVELSLQKEIVEKLKQMGIEVAKETSRSTVSKSLNSQKTAMILAPKASRTSTSLGECPSPKMGSGDTEAKSLIENKPNAMAKEVAPSEGLIQSVQKLQEKSKTQQSNISGSMAAKQTTRTSSPKETKRQSHTKEKKSPKK